MNDPKDIREWNYQQMTGEDSMSPSNPSGHPMIVPQSTPTRQPVELPVERLALVSRVEFDAVERELAEARRERDEALAAWKRVSLEAEHWLSLASKRKDECDEARRDAIEAIDSRNLAIAERAFAEAEASKKLTEMREQRDLLAEAIRLVIEDSELPNGHFWPDVVEKCRAALAAVKGAKP